MPRDIFHLAYSVRMEAEKSDTAEMTLYGEIVEDGPKWWKWSEEDRSAAEFDKEIKAVREKGATKLLLRINSPGGVCTEAAAMRAILGNAGFEEINIRIEGLCASAATDIATIPGAHVAITEGSEYMIHNPWCVCVGNANEIEKSIERLRNIEAVSRGFYARRTGQSEEKIQEWMDAETWFTAEQAVENGFADEVLRAEVTGETPAAACVSGRAMTAMRGLYRTVPDGVKQLAGDGPENPEKPAEENGQEGLPEMVSNDAPAAGASSEIHSTEEGSGTMDVKDISMEELLAENPALIQEIQQKAIAADRERRADIDALTLPGYEAMAEEAKNNGTSALEFQKQIVQAQRQKAAGWKDARAKETAAAENVGAGAAEDKVDEEAEMDKVAREIAMYANQYRGNRSGSMF